MDPTAIFAFGTELLKLINNNSTNKSAAQVKAEGLFALTLAKPWFEWALNDEQKKALAQLEAALQPTAK